MEDKMKKLIIIGGGIAGLSAGVYALQNGFDVEIYEKNAVLGGECTGWNRQGYHIDNCIHWLTGCRPQDDLYQIWRNIGAIDDATELIREPYFYRMETDGKTLHFWCDLEKARREFIETAPEDSAELNKFFDSVRRAESVRVPCEKSLADMGVLEYMKFGMSMAEMGSVIKEYGKETIADLAGRFRNPCIKAMMTNYLNASYKAVTLIASYAFYTGGTAAIPAGGSVAMVQRIVKRFQELGGIVHTGMTAEKININGGRAESVTFADGSRVDCDYVICATDTAVTFGRLLDPKYMDRKLRKMYGTKAGYATASGFQAAFGIAGTKDHGLESGSFIFPCDRFTVGRQEIDRMGMRLYDYDEALFPKEKRVILCNVLQDEQDYEYWKSIYDDRERYLAEKKRIAEKLQNGIVKKFPSLEGSLVFLDSYSPMTFTTWCGAYKGAYMSFFEQKGYKSLTAKNSVRGLKNVFIASQWLSVNGGLPIAVTSGKFAAECLARFCV